MTAQKATENPSEKPAEIAEIRELVSLQLGTPEVGDDDALVETLGAESTDVMNLVATLEDRYEIEVDESELPALRTPRDLFELVRRLVEAP